MSCEMSHDIDIILNYEQKKKANKKKRKRKRKSKQSSQECSVDTLHADISETNGKNTDEDEQPENQLERLTSTTTSRTNVATGNHGAGFDAFMTGFCMAFYYHKYKISGASTFARSIPNFINKLNLSGKDIPLKIEKSRYSKTSLNHNETWKKVISST